MSRVVDAVQRQQALEANGSFIVQAPAGSGKTGLITQRFLVLLARVHSPEEIIAITFTRKAAAEMRDRLLAALRLATKPLSVDADPYLKQTRDLACVALERDAELNWQLLSNPARLRIQTIDSLCASLTRQLPVMARFGAQPGIADDPESLYREAAQQTLADLERGEAWSPAIEDLLAHLDNNLSVAESMLVQMLAKRDQWLRHLVTLRNEDERRELLEQALQGVIDAALQRAQQLFPPMHVSALCELLDFATSHVNDDRAMACCRELTQLPDEDVAQWLGVIELLLKQDGDWRSNIKGITAKQGFPAASSTKDKAEGERFNRKKTELVELTGLLSEVPDLQQALNDIRNLPGSNYSDDQWQIVEAMCELLLVAAAHLRVVFGSRGQVDFSEIQQSALQALGEEDSPTDLALSLDYKIQHLLVDEFQDTSFGQYRLLQRLTAGWQRGDGRTLFLVGDPMQSIYRFREAEVGLYLRARHEGVGEIVLTPLTLSVNFRSQAGIVDWVNQSFAQVFPAQEDVTVGAVSYSDSAAFHGHDGDAVTIHPALSHDSEGEAVKVVQLAQQALQQNSQGTVAVLVRARSHLVAIVAAMKRVGLRYRAIEIEALGHRPVVQDLYALTRALLHPADRIAWLALLRAPWCGLSLVDLAALTRAPRRAVIWDLMQDVALLSAAGQQRLQQLRAVLAQALQTRGRHRLRRWVESVWMQLGGPACVESVTDLEDAEVFFDLLERLDSASGLDELKQLDESLAQLYALPDVDADERIQVMTIHKSKGLEFDTVILPGLGRKAPPSDSPMLVWQERWSDGGSELLLAPVRATGEEHDAIYRYIQKVAAQKGEYETGRVLYVAATRAKRQLHLLGHTTISEDELREPQKSSLLRLLWPVAEPHFSELQRAESPPQQAERVSTTAMPVLRRLICDWQRPSPLAAVAVINQVTAGDDESRDPEYLWASESARHIGTLVHELLQRIAQDGVGQWSGERITSLRHYYHIALSHLGVADDELIAAAQRIEQALLQTLDDERGRWLLDNTHQNSRCEYAVSGLLNGHVVRAVIDRTFIDAEGRRWIVDYKTASYEGGDVDDFIATEVLRYRPQLERYAQMMALEEESSIELGLYFPILKKWYSWPYQSLASHSEG